MNAKYFIVRAMGFACLAWGTTALPATEPETNPSVDWAWLHDPKIVLAEPLRVWNDALPDLWVTALAHQEADLQIQAADSIARGHQLGMPVRPGMIEALAKSLDQAKQHPMARTAAARALVQLEARQSADLLAKHSARGPIELTRVVEPALARWDYEPMRAIWRERLAQPGIRPSLVQLSAECLAVVGDAQAVPPLTGLAEAKHESASIRLAAARALASLQREGLVELAARLAQRKSPRPVADQLVAAHLLSHHTGDAAIEFLEKLAEHQELAVAGQAMQRLLEIAPDRLIARAEQSLIHRDSRIRHLTVQALATRRSAESIASLAPRLDDHDPEIRLHVTRILLGMAEAEELHGAVVEQTLLMLGRDEWRGLEQAILLLTTLKQRQIAPRLLELLDHDRPEVYVAAAWGLRKAAVAELAPEVFAAAESLAERMKASRPFNERGDALAHLLETLGVVRYQPSDAHLRLYVPKFAPYPRAARAAAIWSLGHLHEDQPDAELAKQLEERLADARASPTEVPEVRAVSAVALGRMKSTPSLGVLRDWYRGEGYNSFVGRCAGWSANRIAGDTIRDSTAWRYEAQDWFLQPLKPSD